MGQKANLLTLRKNKNFELGIQNNKLVMPTWHLLHLIIRLFAIKKVFITNYNIQTDTNTVTLQLSVFYSTVKSLIYRDLLSFNTKNKSLKVAFLNKSLNRTLKYYSLLYRFSSFIFSIINTNTFLKTLKNDLKALYLSLIRFSNSLFTRRFNLYLDFIKLTVLFMKKLIPLSSYIIIWGKIFQFLTKRSHTQFFSLTKQVMEFLVSYPGSNIKGLKFLIKGRLKGKERASKMLLHQGKIPLQGFSKNIEYSSTHIYTLYGAYGLKIWTYIA